MTTTHAYPPSGAQPGAPACDGEGQPLLELPHTAAPGLRRVGVRPRWPYKTVLITAKALEGLLAAQGDLDRQGDGLALSVIRGYETPAQTARRNRLRRLGAAIFTRLYPRRRAEAAGIFSTNGHDRSGDHVDVRFAVAGKTPVLLPLGPLTPAWLIRRTHRLHGPELERVWAALRKAGFRIHPNASEALQIHADFGSR
ncbi:MAG: hypothetical protein K8T26_08870 [Lentisphaerae bacterium]|nr:hypothetical protein [Lentisphaerota bacterium]